MKAAKALAGAERGNRATAQRMENAYQGFLSNVIDRGFSSAEARTIFDVYRKARLLKLDAVGGVYTAVHGAIWDKAVMLRALNQGQAAAFPSDK